MSGFLTMGASQLARMIRAGRFSSIEIVEAHIARIEAINPAVNAVTETRFEAARAEAENVDKRLKSKSNRQGWPPLFGVPCSIHWCTWDGSNRWHLITPFAPSFK